MFDEAAVRQAIRDVKDYPKPGIVFKDITPLLKDPKLFGSCMDELARLLEDSEAEVDYIAGVESRGFIVAAALADRMEKGIIPIRKKGKLPYKTVEMSYDLEYGSATIEVHEDAISKGQSVVVADDLLATGGTSSAAAQLVEKLGGKVSAFAFVIELGFLNGRKNLKGDAISLIKY
ncbi:MAG: adenine phosphoribosyltransferase [Candidatus Micrarchaeota archaeon]|nr:adenine phosphoribosyltransferase [Candidatus Micrarchaeota archaeon]